jgi:purine-cytosine permease-like protein
MKCWYSYLILLGTFIPPIGGIIMADYWIHRRGQFPPVWIEPQPAFQLGGGDCLCGRIGDRLFQQHRQLWHRARQRHRLCPGHLCGAVQNYAHGLGDGDAGLALALGSKGEGEMGSERVDEWMGVWVG